MASSLEPSAPSSLRRTRAASALPLTSRYFRCQAARFSSSVNFTPRNVRKLILLGEKVFCALGALGFFLVAGDMLGLRGRRGNLNADSFRSTSFSLCERHKLKLVLQAYD